jgi:hypothetical protein
MKYEFMQDYSHVTFGVITVGYFYKRVKIDTSLFNGREPDEKRYDIDEPRFDSGSIRLSMNPSNNTCLQFSHGYIKEPEVLEPGGEHSPYNRISYLELSCFLRQHAFNGAGLGNEQTGPRQGTKFLAEADYQFGENALFTRMEFIKKSGEELGLEEEKSRDLFSISAFTLGIARTIFSSHNVSISIGALCTVSPVERDLGRIYGGVPFSIEGYLRFSPGSTKKMTENHMMYMGH